MALIRLCSTPGCDELTVDARRCPAHIRAADRRRGTSSQRGYNDPAWRRVRKLVLERDEYRCRIRGRGCTEVATTVDHIVPLSAGGARLDPANLQAACSWDNVSKGARLPSDDPK